MKNKRVKQMIYSGFCELHGKYTDNWDKTRNEWAFDRFRLCESRFEREKLRHSHLSMVSIKGKVK